MIRKAIIVLLTLGAVGAGTVSLADWTSRLVARLTDNDIREGIDDLLPVPAVPKVITSQMRREYARKHGFFKPPTIRFREFRPEDKHLFYVCLIEGVARIGFYDSGGDVRLAWDPYQKSWMTITMESGCKATVICLPRRDLERLGYRTNGFRWRGRVSTPSQACPGIFHTFLRFPLWEASALFALYPTLTFIRGPLRRWRRRRKGLCLNCGYNLTGNVTGVCPECGEGL